MGIAEKGAVSPKARETRRRRRARAWRWTGREVGEADELRWGNEVARGRASDDVLERGMRYTATPGPGRYKLCATASLNGLADRHARMVSERYSVQEKGVGELEGTDTVEKVR